MIYAVSDLHGCYDKFVKLLDKIRFGEDDLLYVLGDVVDRGPENVRLITALAGKRNICTLMGNHDYVAALMLKTYGMPDSLEPDTKVASRSNAQAATDLFEAWLSDGGAATWKEFMGLDYMEKEVVRRFLESRPVFTEIEVNGQTYHLSHTVPEKDKMLDEGRRVLSDFLFGSPEYNKVYFPDKILVTGHTPTGLIEEAAEGRILRKNNHIAIDCGAVFGNPLGCICLDTGEEVYVE